jgi:Arc/MetJ family transcription regulator
MKRHTWIRVDAGLADEAAMILGVKSRAEAVHTARREVVGLERFKRLMRKYRGKLEFAGCDEQPQLVRRAAMRLC